LAGKRAVVFSGGGAKGGYQIGVWKALREIGFVPDIVTGTSVGAMNGALMAAGKYEEACEIWENMSMDSVFSLFADASETGSLTREECFSRLSKEILRGGADCEPLRIKVKSLMDEDLLRGSDIEFGLVTTKFPNIRPVKLFISDIPYGEVADYILASSACFPFIKSVKIRDKTFIDGGYSDNMPLQMAIDRGADDIVTVNIGKMALQKYRDNGALIRYIQNRRPFNDGQKGALMLFDKELSLQNIRQGYLDTLKEFNLLDGYVYAFEKYERYRIGAFDVICSGKFDMVYSSMPNAGRIEKLGRQSIINYFKKYEDRPFEFNANVLYCAETAAELLDLSTLDIYTLQGMSALLVKESAALLAEDTAGKIAELTRLLDKGLSIDLLKTVIGARDKRLLTGFCLQLLLEDKLGFAGKSRLWAVSAMMPEVFCGALFCCAAILQQSPAEKKTNTKEAYPGENSHP